MSKMNDLAAVLDEMAAAAEKLTVIGDNLLRFSVRLRNALGGEENPDPNEQSGDTPAPAAATPRTPRRRQAAPEPPQPPKAPETQEAPTLSKEEVRGMLSDLAGRGRREEAKALVAKYSGGGSFSDIDPARYPELAEEVRALG